MLKADRDAFLRGLTEKMLTYALGRGLERYDRPAVSPILSEVEANDYRFSSLILGIVKACHFRCEAQLRNA